ncbi:hypothetical protein SCB71_04765 [Herbiconiux sp. KACC 21604]|uniref:DUF7144 family membrane protein n=1 Tax=unclassified Herbiconiux TaxID=2618217 RepID=UPI001492515F|nr:hypothetical protein [Herbiconiux sp. SALV-R1]QJU52663.1 hypothetical protein HL652_02740 [Herbiconiux sp. SALV-R1]WPO87559.1 hypothetical protein SCB71_04765 [Herbiconiux sp. KACC 21604]
MKRPGGVTLVAVIVWISGALQVIGGVIGLITASTTAEANGAPDSAGTLTATAVVSIVLGIITVVVGAALLRGSQIARVLTTIVLALNLLGGIYFIVAVPSSLLQGILNSVLAVIGLVLLYTRSANAFFRR